MEKAQIVKEVGDTYIERQNLSLPGPWKWDENVSLSDLVVGDTFRIFYGQNELKDETGNEKLTVLNPPFILDDHWMVEIKEKLHV